MSRGYVSEEDSGANNNYYLYTNVWYYLISSRDTLEFKGNMIGVSITGRIGYYHVGTLDGVLYSRIMLLKIILLGRGCISNDNKDTLGSNENYYIQINWWFLTISPVGLASDSHASTIGIHSPGYLGNDNINSEPLRSGVL